MVIDNSFFFFAAIYLGVAAVVLWIAMVLWAYRDMRARSRDGLARLFVVAVVALLYLPGLLIYILLRPRETLSEAYERSLEEEALLQEIEEKPTCPGCGQRVHANWQACPYCLTRLKKLCFNCSELLELTWNLCPYCVADQTRYQPNDKTVQASRHVHKTVQEPPPSIPDKWLSDSMKGSKASSDAPRYIDE